MIWRYILCVVILAVLSACATAPNPQRVTRLQTQEANLAIKEKMWREKSNEWKDKAGVLRQEAILLSNHPGWSDMSNIIKDYVSFKHFEGQQQADVKLYTLLIQWGQKWQTNGPALYDYYKQFIKRWIYLAESIDPSDKECGFIAQEREKLDSDRIPLKMVTQEESVYKMMRWLDNCDTPFHKISIDTLHLLGFSIPQ